MQRTKILLASFLANVFHFTQSCFHCICLVCLYAAQFTCFLRFSVKISHFTRRIFCVASVVKLATEYQHLSIGASPKQTQGGVLRSFAINKIGFSIFISHLIISSFQILANVLDLTEGSTLI